MSHGRTLYRCGCLQSQCRCFSRAGHADRWLDYPCPKHPDITVRLGQGDVVVKADGRVPPGEWGWALNEMHGVIADRDRLLPEFTD